MSNISVSNADFDLLQAIKTGTLDLKALESIPRSKLVELQSLLTPKMTKYIPHVPTAKQTAFMLLDSKEAFYGGAAGGGKSDCLLMCGLQYVDVPGYAGIIFRKSYADLVKPGALIDRSKEWLSQYPDVKWLEKDKKFEFLDRYGPHKETRSILQFGYLENDNDRFNYQGGEYQFIAYDELTHMSETSYRYLFSRLRKLKHMQIPLRVRGASNPPDDDKGIWVYNRFVNPETKSPNATFIPAGLDDNPHLDKEEYEQALDELDPITRERLKHGVWTIKRKGNMLKREWFEEVDKPPMFRKRVRFWDMAATDAELAKKRNKSAEPDFTVGALVSEHKGIYYIEDFSRFRKSPATTQQMQKIVASSDGKRVKIAMEQEPGSSGLISIDHYIKNVFRGYPFKGVRSTGNKIERANPVSSLAERGCIKIVRGCRFKDEFFNEAESFPGGLHDDMVDAVSGAIGELMSSIVCEGAVPTIVGEQESYWSRIEI